MNLELKNAGTKTKNGTYCYRLVGLTTAEEKAYARITEEKGITVLFCDETKKPLFYSTNLYGSNTYFELNKDGSAYYITDPDAKETDMLIADQEQILIRRGYTKEQARDKATEQYLSATSQQIYNRPRTFNIARTSRTVTPEPTAQEPATKSGKKIGDLS